MNDISPLLLHDVEVNKNIHMRETVTNVRE
jgi:hypothetical protein